MTLQTRPLSCADLDAVVAIEAGAHPHPWRRGQFADALAAGYWCDGWFDETGQPAALVGYTVLMPVVDELELLNITVAPARQGCGLGRRLLDAACARGARDGFASMLLEVRPSNLAARALYARAGFAEIGRRRDYYPGADGTGREDALILRATLMQEAR